MYDLWRQLPPSIRCYKCGLQTDKSLNRRGGIYNHQTDKSLNRRGGIYAFQIDKNLIHQDDIYALQPDKNWNRCCA